MINKVFTILYHKLNEKITGYKRTGLDNLWEKIDKATPTFTLENNFEWY